MTYRHYGSRPPMPPWLKYVGLVVLVVAAAVVAWLALTQY